MSEGVLFRLAADAMLFMHALFVAFVVVGLVLVYIGKWRGWCWVRNRCFRIVHLLGVCVVVVQSWLGVLCPLTVWEMNLRAKAGGATYTGAFVAHWVEAALYYRAPDWVFVVVYTVFGILVVTSWCIVRPTTGRTVRGRDED